MTLDYISVGTHRSCLPPKRVMLRESIVGFPRNGRKESMLVLPRIVFYGASGNSCAFSASLIGSLMCLVAVADPKSRRRSADKILVAGVSFARLYEWPEFSFPGATRGGAREGKWNGNYRHGARTKEAIKAARASSICWREWREPCTRRRTTRFPLPGYVSNRVSHSRTSISARVGGNPGLGLSRGTNEDLVLQATQ
jgi:hypothetical protein